MKHLKLTSALLTLSLGLCIAAASQAAPIEPMQPLPTNSRNTLKIPMHDIQRFATAISQIKHYYIKPISYDKLFDHSIQGMLNGLDPHSDYLDPQEFKELRNVTSGKFGGIGIEVLPKPNFIEVISPLDDTPAALAGIKAGDMIVRIDGKLVKNMKPSAAIRMIRGPKGSTVNLTILRKGENKPIPVKVKRATIKAVAVKNKMLPENYGYVRVGLFQSPTAKDLHNAIAKLKKESKGKLQGLILDLRNNPGGILEAAVETADTFLDTGTLKYEKNIVYTKSRIPGGNIYAKSRTPDFTGGLPLVVLINGGSASGSEIVAGALQDYKRAVIVGSRSFGKGSVQTVLPIDKKTAIKLTTALYYTPAGRSIQATGITPDVVLPAIQLPQAKKNNDSDADQYGNVDESDLNGYLANGNGHSKKGSKSDADLKKARETAEKTLKKQTIALARKDFQLYQAYNVLRGLATTH